MDFSESLLKTKYLSETIFPIGKFAMITPKRLIELRNVLTGDVKIPEK